ncbi:hypothetical protein V462_11035 [Pantoea ananatis 15320]|nr:hypothetical protein V462_11035 [Pantoea ananatis 15320]
MRCCLLDRNITLPLLEWQQQSVEVKIARNDYEHRVLEFKRLLYKSISSIEDELSLRNQPLVQYTRLREGLELVRKSERLNEVYYRQGAASISFWLDAKEKRHQAELMLDENSFNQLQNLAKIYLEFGGSSTFLLTLPQKICRLPEYAARLKPDIPDYDWITYGGVGQYDESVTP